MTERQRAIADFITWYWSVNWTSPTVREIAEGVGLSSSASVHKQLERMTLAGDLECKQLSSLRVLYRVPHLRA